MELPDDDVLHARMYGVRADGIKDDTAALQRFFNDVCKRKKKGVLPKGTIYCTSQIELDLQECWSTGVNIVGAGLRNTTIQFASTVASPNFLVTNKKAGVVAGSHHSYYLYLRDFGILGSVAGTVFQVCKYTDADSNTINDAINEGIVDLWVYNASTDAAAVAVKIRYALNIDFRFVANCVGASYALLIDGATFCSFKGSYSAILGTSVVLGLAGSNSNVYGNSFHSLDMENVSTCVINASDRAVANTFIGGTWSYDTVGYTAQYGTSNMVINPNLTPASPATVSTFINQGKGVCVKTNHPSYLNATTPTVPATTVPYTNVTGMDVSVYLNCGAEVTSVAVDGVAIYSNALSIGKYVFHLRQGETVTMVYASTAPTWVFRRC